MNGIARITFAAALAALAVTARAAGPINDCTTPDGGRFYGDDTARGQCGDALIRRLNPDASPKDPIPAPLTPEQKKRREQEQKRLAECHRQNKEQYQKDSALLDRFRREEDLQAARYGELGEQMKLIDEANQRLKENLAARKHLDELAEFYQPPRSIPVDLRYDLELKRRLQEQELHNIERAVGEIRHLDEEYDVKLKRYRELVNGLAKMPCEAKP